MPGRVACLVCHPLRKPGGDLSHKLLGLHGLAMPFPELCQAQGRTEFPGLRVLLARQLQRLPQALLGLLQRPVCL